MSTVEASPTSCDNCFWPGPDLDGHRISEYHLSTRFGDHEQGAWEIFLLERGHEEKGEVDLTHDGVVELLAGEDGWVITYADPEAFDDCLVTCEQIPVEISYGRVRIRQHPPV